ncbi:hypothetical protein BAE44_0019263 [Dichanthelium oligosanthes]|uniref:Uncharacterized protein n=1 Tax=Dichanthelium oligosanthes TaxID=888268 RepID=A0A1E5V3N7_9POAL|nr:hypothetical protein BAE44_0019263 [Dichanthelium oligosanthes]
MKLPSLPVESVAAWLAVAARRLSGSLTIKSQVKNTNEDGGEAGKRGIFHLLCFERATTVSLDLGFLGLSLPPAGTFAQLTGLSLQRVRFHGPCELGDAVSSPISPSVPGGMRWRGGGPARRRGWRGRGGAGPGGAGRGTGRCGERRGAGQRGAGHGVARRRPGAESGAGRGMGRRGGGPARRGALGRAAREGPEPRRARGRRRRGAVGGGGAGEKAQDEEEEKIRPDVWMRKRNKIR